MNQYSDIIFLFRIEPDGIIKIEELQQRIDSIDLQFNKKILIKRLFDGRICCQVGEACYVNRPDVFEYLLKHEAAKSVNPSLTITFVILVHS